MRQHLISAAVAGVVAVGTAGAVLHAYPPTTLVTKSGKPMPGAWGELSPTEIGALARMLRALPPGEVAIFCASRDCEDLALDFDNVFEAARWKSGIERPMVDTNTGINVGPNDDTGRALAGAIAVATAGRIRPGLIESHLVGGRLALVISKRVR